MHTCDHCTPCAIQRIEKNLIRINKSLIEMRMTMANEADQLNEVLTKLTDVHADVRAKLDAVRAETSPEGQAKLDEIKSALQSFDDEVGDADGSDTPTEPVPGDEGGFSAR